MMCGGIGRVPAANGRQHHILRADIQVINGDNAGHFGGTGQPEAVGRADRGKVFRDEKGDVLEHQAQQTGVGRCEAGVVVDEL